MSTEIVRSQTPEEEELARKLAELATLETEQAAALPRQCQRCFKHFMTVTQREHHDKNAARLCHPEVN
jgi:hypothetical protein